jgi:predicted unusual protein kinase regulating ubiquinone biosynthesis (AarF/ABC1/UbiB family)
MFFKILFRAFSVGWIAFKYGLVWLFRPKLRPVTMRRAFEDLGPTYLKLGQLISSSPGLFPENYCNEFKKCLDQVPPFPFEEVKRIIEEEMGKPASEVFASLEPEPIAAASIAQVHGAILPDGSDVVIKVQRPKIPDWVDADLFYMGIIARVGEWLFYDLRLANATGVVADFSKTIHEELDFVVEGKNMDEFNEIMKRHGNDHLVVAPIVHWDFTTRRLLTMERFYGFKADDVERARALGHDTEKWLRIGMRSWNMSMMLHGFFHGDVHAGNLMFLPDREQIGLIDFGIIGRFDDKQRMLVMRYILSFATQDYMELAKVILDMNANVGHVDVNVLAEDMETAYKPLLEQNISEIDYAKMLPTIMAMVRKHGIRQPREFVLIIKQLLYFDRYAKLAAPTLNVFNDVYLVDFLFQPSAAECGIDMAQVGQLMMTVQRALAERQAGT